MNKDYWTPEVAISFVLLLVVALFAFCRLGTMVAQEIYPSLNTASSELRSDSFASDK